MTQRTERPLSLACVADQSAGAAVLHEALLALFPAAIVTRVDTTAERVLPGSVDCAVIDSTVNGTDSIDVLRRLRASGYDGAAVLVVAPTQAIDEAGAARLGGRSCALNGSLTRLAAVISDALLVQGGPEEAPAATALRDLRQTQRLMAAGELALRLQHSLNNPLAALLAEAQLLELEPLAAEHRASVERIIELSRRVVEVVRGLDGVGRA
jgi:signal transduction histidine kinase